MLAKLRVYGLAILVAGVSMSLLYIYPNIPRKCQFYVEHYTLKVSNYVGSFFCKPDVLVSETETGEKLFTLEELKKYDGSADSPGLYVGLLGKVYNVEKGAQHYKPGGGYAFFAGKDATKAYVTGDFTDEGLTDDVSGLADDLIDALVQWQGFYEKEYAYVGKLVGRFYNNYGKPTDAMLEVEKAVERAEVEKQKLEDEKKLFPPCNSEWEHGKGGRVWCSINSGGVEREWSGVPREYFKPGQTTPSCVCIRTTGPPSLSIEGVTDNDRGDLDNPNMKLFDDCAVDSESCKTPS